MDRIRQLKKIDYMEIWDETGIQLKFMVLREICGTITWLPSEVVQFTTYCTAVNLVQNVFCGVAGKVK
jgi:hypothetical protein